MPIQPDKVENSMQMKPHKEQLTATGILFGPRPLGAAGVTDSITCRRDNSGYSLAVEFRPTAVDHTDLRSVGHGDA